MKTIILAIILVALASCSKANCEEEARQATAQYQTALQYSGGSQAAIDKITAEYNAKINKIYSECE